MTEVQNSFTGRNNAIPSYLKRVATLLCTIQMLENLYNPKRVLFNDIFCTNVKKVSTAEFFVGWGW